jgi:hypothetical protein
MSSLRVETNPLACDVAVTDAELIVDLADGAQDQRSFGLVPAPARRHARAAGRGSCSATAKASTGRMWTRT